MMRKHAKVIITLAIAAVLLLAGGTVALAWGPDARPGRLGPDGTSVIAEKLGMSVEELQTQLRAGETLADLAEAQGVALADLKAAVDAAQEANLIARIEQAFTAGNLTRERADWMIQGVEQGYGLGKGGRGIPFGRGAGLGPDEQPGLGAAAEALGMTVDELSLQMWGGRTLADLAERQGVDLETVLNAMQEARETAMREAIAEAVANGRITQQQADWILEGIENGYAPRLGGRRMPGGRGMPRGGEFGGRPGPGGGMGPAPTDSGSGAGFRAPRVLGGNVDAA